jgi:hypothetical protein
MTGGRSLTFHEVTPERADEWVATGHLRRHFFAHRVVRLPKCGPDAFNLSRWMCGIEEPAAMWELVLYADPELAAAFPPELFADDDLVWHQQQFGLPGQVATASVVLEGDTVHALTYVSDVVQRISRRREHKTQVEKRFKGWVHMLANAVLCFAADQGATVVRSASAELARRHTDHSRDPLPEMFERVYDRTLLEMLAPRRDGEWWVVDVAQARDRTVAPVMRTETRARERTICVSHDVERGLGHLDVDPGFARQAEADAPRHLDAMRAVEAQAGVRATYCVVGALLDDLRPELEADGHCLAFHSYDHQIDREDQLARCRSVDYRLKGYRPPRSQITPELTDHNLLARNFEWLASSPRSLGAAAPQLRNGIVRLPVALDDFPLHTGAASYEQWETGLFELVADADFLAVGLHDCYADRWLDRYPRLLERLGESAVLRTLDEVAADVMLEASA